MIIKNTIRQKLDSGEPTISTRFMSSEPDIAELIGDTGLFDYAEYYAEGSAVSMPSLYHIARAAQCGNLPLMVKLDQESQGFWAQAAVGAGFQAINFTDIRSSMDIEALHRTIRPDNPEKGGMMGVTAPTNVGGICNSSRYEKIPRRFGVNCCNYHDRKRYCRSEYR